MSILWIQSLKAGALESGAAELFALLNIRDCEFRESAHVAGGTYALGRALGLKVALRYNTFCDYRWEVEISDEAASGAEPSVLDGVCSIVCFRLATLGVPCIRVLQLSKIEVQFMAYSPSSSSEPEWDSRVDIRRRTLALHHSADLSFMEHDDDMNCRPGRSKP